MSKVLYQNSNFRIEGEIDTRFLLVLEQFKKHFLNGLDDKAQVCVFYQNKKVIDICGYPNDDNYSLYSVQNIFSSGKNITSLVIAILVDRGLLEYGQPISDIWPEFAQGGKGDITIAHLMRHEAGLYLFSRLLEVSELTTENITNGTISSIIEKEIPRHKPGKKRVYHPVTRGLIVNEIVRRVDPKKRTIKQFVYDEITKPLNIDHSVTLGLPEFLWPLDTKLTNRPILNSWLDLLLGRKKTLVPNIIIRLLLIILLPFIYLLQLLSIFPSKTIQLEDNTLEGKIKMIGKPEWKLAELSSANIHASARGLATIGNAILQPGTLISKEGLEKANSDIIEKRMFHGLFNSHFSNAGWNHFKEKRFGFIGWVGLGGSVMQWHPKHKCSFAYTMNMMEISPTCERARALQKTLIQCLKKID